VGPDKYDETAAAMIAQLKYGAGTPFYRLEQLGKPVEASGCRRPRSGRSPRVAQINQAGADELIRQSAQGTVSITTIPACECSC